MLRFVSLACLVAGLPSFAQLKDPINLPTSKQLFEPVPGSPKPLNSLPMSMAWSPDGRYLAILNAGYGTYESQYSQSIALLDTRTGDVLDFPEERTQGHVDQTLYQGLAFSNDGKHLYASFESLSAPEGGKPNQTGNAVAIYQIADGKLTAERLMAIPLQPLAVGKKQNAIGATLPKGKANPAPAGLAVLKGANGSEQILVADNFSDDALLLDAASGKILYRFDLSDKASPVVPSTYPISVTVTANGQLGFVALWNGSAVAELNLRTGKVVQTLSLQPPAKAILPSSHPTAFAFGPGEKQLYVALANRDAVAAINLAGGKMHLRGYFDTRLPGQTFFGAMPDAVAVSADGKRLYAANTGSNAIAVFDTQAKLSATDTGAGAKALGFIPTEWYPTALAFKEGKLYVATAKGKGTGPNAAPQRVVEKLKQSRRDHTYIATLLYGSLAVMDSSETEARLAELTKETILSNRITAAMEHIKFASGQHPIKHVIYIIKENRTYDQIFGDLGAGNGDPNLTMYGREITPNQHKLAEQFGVIDNFYDSGEVSGDGHVWSTAAITSDYTEKNWQQDYRGGQRMYDYEGVVEEGYPLEEGISDVNEPNSGYLWTNFARHGKSLYHFGEFVSTEFCDESGEAPKKALPTEGTPEPVGAGCPRSYIREGEEVPANYGGGKSPWPWKIPLILKNTATKPELQGHFDASYPDFNLSFPDQLRFEEFMGHFKQWVEKRQAGKDEMPNFVMLRFPNDHTAGTHPGMPRPRASVADNDLAIGRAVEAISNSAYWDDTAFFILEDDAQDGADHVDAHRSLALVISKYAPRQEKPFVDSQFYTTVSMIRTMEDVLGVPPMNNNDAFSSLMAPLFTGAGDQPAFHADYRNRDNGMIYEVNAPTAPGAKESSKMDFRHEDRANPKVLNVVLWKDAMGSKPVPEMILHPHGTRKDDDD